MNSINAKESSNKDFSNYLKNKPTEFLKGLEKTGLKALGKEKHKQVSDELKRRDKLKKIMETEKERHLALWCMEQAKLHSEGKLSKERYDKLKEIDFPFDDYLAIYEQHNMTFEKYEKESD